MNQKIKPRTTQKSLKLLLEKLKELELMLNLSKEISAEDKKILSDYFNKILANT